MILCIGIEYLCIKTILKIACNIAMFHEIYMNCVVKRIKNPVLVCILLGYLPYFIVFFFFDFCIVICIKYSVLFNRFNSSYKLMAISMLFKVYMYVCVCQSFQFHSQNKCLELRKHV